jgi:hypothetical protein
MHVHIFIFIFVFGANEEVQTKKFQTVALLSTEQRKQQEMSALQYHAGIVNVALPPKLWDANTVAGILIFHPPASGLVRWDVLYLSMNAIFIYLFIFFH